MTSVASWTSILLGLALSGAPALADEAIRAEGPLAETLIAKAEISRVLVAGFQSIGAAPPERPALWAAVPASWRGKSLCLRLLSADGTYTAQQSFAVSPDWRGGVSPLGFATAFADRLEALKADEMAVRISLGDCSTGDAVYALGSWNSDRRSGPMDGVLLLNSMRASEVYLIEKGTGRELSCTVKTADASTSFDTLCPIPAPLLGGEGRLTFEVNSIRRGTFDPVTLLSIEKGPP